MRKKKGEASKGKGRPRLPENSVVVVLCDYENVNRVATDKFTTVDWKKLSTECAKIGTILFKFLVVPKYIVRVGGLPLHIFEMGWFVILSKKGREGYSHGNPEAEIGKKEKDWADDMVKDLGERFRSLKEITHIVVVADDGDYSRFETKITETFGKKLIIIGSDQMSFFLKEVVTPQKYGVLPLTKRGT